MVFPSILGADFGRMAEDCRSVLELGCEALHLDVMDGHFVPNLTMGPDMCRWLRRHFPEAYLDVHLMVQRPEQFVQPFADAGANCMTFHIEATLGRKEQTDRQVAEQIHATGCQAGIVLNPSAPAASVMHLLDAVDMVLVMSVHPGFAGQKFMPGVLDKARQLRAAAPRNVRIQIDGGITPDTATLAREAGCDVLVAASAIFNAKDRAVAIDEIRGR